MNINEKNIKQMETMRQNLKSLRKVNGWSLEELSEVSGISKTILTNIEEGKNFEIGYLIDLCRAYKIKLHEIFYPII